MRDLIVMAGSKECVPNGPVDLASWLGFAINWQKSKPQPLQMVEYLGVVAVYAAGSSAMRLGATLTALPMMQAPGFMATPHPMVPLGLLHM